MAARRVIARTIHRIWLGPHPIPAEAETYWGAFAALHPGWEFRTWTDADDYTWLRNWDLFESADTWTSRSDVLRFEILARFGGIYVDTDVRPLKSFAPLMDAGAFAGWEDARNICGAVMGAEAGHPAIEALIAALPGWTDGRVGAPPHEWAGPRFLTAQWSGRTDVRLEPPRSFYPVHWGQKVDPNGRYPASYAVHHWAKSWSRVREPRLSILMAWTDRGDTERRAVKDWVAAFWTAHLPGAELVFGTDTTGGDFNRSASFNDAADRATGDVFFITDADLCFDPGVVRTAVEVVSGSACWVVPWRTNFRLTAAATAAMLAEDPATYAPPARPLPRTWEGTETGIGMRFGGGCAVIPRAAWELLGGHDPRFVGWGSEDIGFSLAMDTLWGPHLVPPVNMLHLYHPRAGGDTRNPALELRYWAAQGRPEAMRELLGITAEAPPLSSPTVPRGWMSSVSMRRKPGEIPRQRERYLEGLLSAVPA